MKYVLIKSQVSFGVQDQMPSPPKLLFWVLFRWVLSFKQKHKYNKNPSY